MDTLRAPSQPLDPKAMLLNHPSHPLLVLGGGVLVTGIHLSSMSPTESGQGVLERVWVLEGTL